MKENLLCRIFIILRSLYQLLIAHARNTTFRFVKKKAMIKMQEFSTGIVARICKRPLDGTEIVFVNEKSVDVNDF